MNRKISLFACFLGASLTLSAHAGTLTYQPLPGTNTDAGSGIDQSNVYTSAVDGGNTQGADRTINGVPFPALVGSGNSVTVNYVTVSVASGNLANVSGQSKTLQADGALGAALSDGVTNDNADNNSEQYVVLDPSSLTAGKTYDLRLYIGNSSSQNRQISLSFVGDATPPSNTDFFNEDDATSSPGAFNDPNQVYYINYRYTWDGSTTPGFTVTQKSSDAPFILYALTNQEVAGEGAPSQQVAEATMPPPQESGEPVGDDQVGVSSDTFYTDDSLNQSGRWVTVGNYGRCWQPVGQPADWRPYTVGRWRYADVGWTWDSSEPWGWCTYHYGRWARVDGVGWCWVPGRVWAPSWCSWRFGHGYVGWAPLPPQAVCNVNVGISTWADSSYGLGPGYYNFCQAGEMGSDELRGVIIDRERNIELLDQTTNVTNIVNNNAYIYAGGPNIRVVNGFIARSGHQPFDMIKVDRHFSPAALGPNGHHTLLKAGVLAIAAPLIVHSLHAHLPKSAVVVKDPKFDHGWKMVKDPRVEEQLKHRIASQTKGLRPDNAHAFLPGSHATHIVKPGAKVDVSQLKKPGLKEQQQIRKPGMPYKPSGVKEEIRKPGEINKGDMHKPGVTTHVEEPKREIHNPAMDKHVEQPKREVHNPEVNKHVEEPKREVHNPAMDKHVEEPKREVHNPDVNKHVDQPQREVHNPAMDKHVEEPKREVHNPAMDKHTEQPKREVHNPDVNKHVDQPKRETHNVDTNRHVEEPKRENHNADVNKHVEQPKHETHNAEQPKHVEQPKREVHNNEPPKHEAHNAEPPKHSDDKKKDQHN